MNWLTENWVYAAITVVILLIAAAAITARYDAEDGEQQG